ncbi:MULTISPECIES: alpha/beta fold hydrolase [unclassified Streptomyces]|uniref:alpha/beta fold hydrolase n=1 Tax=unclassified Streptomyces TaxID=2593676 RepID=UPI002E1907F1|nr:MULTISPECIES: alpha/beta fold hydrolase [unclassified Streptomyces]
MTVPGRLRAASDADPAPSVHTKTVRVDGFPLSARVCSAPSPRAVIFALHGGGTTSLYFDCPGRPEFSLLRTGAQLGYAVVAMDRPGYGISTPYAERYRDPQRRLETTYAAMERFLDQLPGRPAVFVAAHSAGCELAMRMAADPRGLRLLGLEIAGTGLRHQPATIRALEAAGVTRQRYGRRPAGTRETLWGPAELYAEDVWNTPYIASDSPAYESPARAWVERDFVRLAAEVRIPVQFSLGDHERVWESGPAALAEITGLFTAAPRVRANEQAGCGHNLSLGLAARSYHLRVLAFAEECVVQREHGEKGEAA